MEETKKSPWWVITLTIVKYVITAVLGALGGAAGVTML